MECIRVALVVCLLCQIPTNESAAQWRPTNGPFGGIVICLAVYDTSLFAGIHPGKGIFRSTNKGANWTSVNNGLTTLLVSAMVSSDTSLFAGTARGISRSSNNGTTWGPVNTVLTDVRVFAVRPNGTGGMYIFAGKYGSGVFRSTDNGVSWPAVNTGLTNLNILTLFTHDTNLFAGTSGGVFRSTNNGTSWDSAGLTNLSVHAFAARSNGSSTVLFAGTSGGGVRRTTDNGINWVTVNNGLTNLNAYALFTFDTRLFAGTSSGIFLSTNNGTTWAPAGLTNQSVGTFASIPHGSSTDLFAGTFGGGVFLSSNGGANWTPVNTGLAGPEVRTLAANGPNLFCGTFYGEAIYLSTDNGLNWSTRNSGFWNRLVGALAINSSATGGTTLFAGTSYGSDGEGAVFRSTNNGVSWNSVFTILNHVTSFALNGTSIFAGTGGGVFRSSNNGTAWTRVDSGLTNNSVRALVVNSSAGIDTTIFAGTLGGIFRTTNNGTSWTAVNTTLTSVLALAVVPGGIAGANIYAGNYGTGVFRSTNNGTNWTAVNTGLTNLDVWALAVSGPNLFAAVYGAGVFLSSNNGVSWTEANTGLADKRVLSLAINGANLFVGTYGNAVWRRPLSEMITGIQNQHNDVPSRYVLQQNYPNPFNPETKIKFSVGIPSGQIPNSSEVTLKVFDLLGREVATLVNERLQPGSFETTFDGSGLASGVYFYRLSAGSFVETKKLMLLR